MEHLDGDREWVGEWFLPNTTRRVPGLLRYAGGQVRLELLHPLAGMAGKTAQTVLGRTRQGPVTLSNVVFDAFGHAIAYSAVFLPPESAEKLFEAHFGFDLLKEWAVPGRPHEDAAKIYYGSDPDKAGVGPVARVESRLDDDVVCTLSVRLEIAHHVIEGVWQYHDSWFTIKSKRGLSVGEIAAKYVQPIKHFLMAAMGRSINLSEMRAIVDGQPADVYLPVERQSSSGSDLDHFFNIWDIRDAFDGILRSWFELHSKSPLHMRMFFRTLDSRYSDVLYFYVYATVVEIWTAASPTTTGNNREKIKRALASFEDDFENIDEFADKVFDTRNAMVHYIPSYDLDVDEPHKITHDLFYLIRVMLLECCGVKVRHEHGRFAFLKKRSGSRRFPALPLGGYR